MKYLILLASLLIGFHSQALAFQPKNPECIAPAKPGGGFDLSCRIVAKALRDTGQTNPLMKVTFMPGGIGAVAYNHINTARSADPNAIVAFSTGSLLNLAQGKFGKFDETNARWLGTIGTDYGAVIVRNIAPWSSLEELMANLKANPSSIVIGAGGTAGSQDWMKAALLMKAIGVDYKQMRYAAFEGGGEAITALLGNHIDVYMGDVSDITGHFNTGQLRVLAILSEERLPGQWSETPTAKEKGYDVVWPVIRGYYMGPEVSDEAYNWWVKAFQNMYATKKFAYIRNAKGLYEFNKAGSELDDFVNQRMRFFRELLTEMDMDKKRD